MKHINLQCDYLSEDYLNKLKEMEKKVNDVKESISSKTGKGSEYLGWVDHPLNITECELEEINNAANRMHELGEYLVVIGIGGSYLGAKAIIDALSGYYDNRKVIFLGNNISPEYLYSTLEFLKEVDFTVNVISKSGKTLEPALAFRFVKDLLIKKYNSKYNERIFVTTSKKDSLLNTEAEHNKYKQFVIPFTIGGRYSVFTAVGLLPIAFAGFDIMNLIKGSFDSCNDCAALPFLENNALKYACLRNLLYQNNKQIEILATYEPKFHFFGEWWKQLYGESEGKDGKGIFPVYLSYSTDLHSLGQYVQDGIKNIFETVIVVKEDREDITVVEDAQNIDKLNYLAGKNISFIRKQIMEGVSTAHYQGNCPNIILTIDKIDEYHIGYLMYFFMYACGISGYLLNVNPFNQDGVELYKNNMFALLKGKKN